MKSRLLLPVLIFLGILSVSASTLPDFWHHPDSMDRGNYNSRGSHGCVTIHPEDAEAFFSHFSWTNKKPLETL